MFRFNSIPVPTGVRPYRVATACTFALSLLSLAPRDVHAQAIEIPEIVISANQTPAEASRVGASVTVLSGPELRATNVPTVADALRQVPGLSVDQSGTNGTLTQVRIRGGEANQFMVLVDGIEINGLGDGGFDFADMPVADIERIEVIRGPQSGIYGANAQTGVISIITVSGKGLAKPVFRARVEGGSENSATGNFNLRGASGPFYGSLTTSYNTSGGYNISRFGWEPDGSRALTMTGKAGVDVTENLNIEGVVRHVDRWADTDPQDFNFFSPRYGFVVDGNAGTEYRATAGRLGATLSLLDRHWVQSLDFKIFDEHTGGYTNGVQDFGADGTRTNIVYKSTIKFDTAWAGGEQHEATVLVDKRNEHYVQFGNNQPYDKERTSLAGEYRLNLPTHTSLSAAVRQDWNTGFTDVLTWRFALSQRFPTTGSRLHASTGKGVTDPNVFELFGSQFNVPNPNLKPEQSIGWDVGLEQTFLNGKIVTDVTYFSSDFTNKIEFAFDPVTFEGIYVNGEGKAIRRGVEVLGKFNVLDWLTVTATYTYVDAKDSEGNPEIRRPPHSGSLEATAFFDQRKGQASVGVSYNSTRTDYFFQPTGTEIVNLPSTAIVRASLSYEVAPNATLYVRARNVFNTQYEEIFSYRAPGFAAFAGLKVKFGE